MQSISSELDNFINGGNLLVSTKIETYDSLLVDTVSYFTNKNISGAILSLNKSYTMLTKTFEANKINTKDITFIDPITYNQEKTEGNCIYMARPFNPTNAALIITKLAQSPQIKFFIFDSLTTLLLSYNPVNTVKFFQFILPKLSSQKKLSLVFSLDSDPIDPNTNLIIKLCNKVVTV